ncbi:hypothetical protein ST37_13855 [Vibrio sp. qd031]|uniref:DUF2007 domain-containing protein n=1 Tax=Vibrio sp. qd031 TaxID=1603038 RepID=UPI000A1141AB|nr:DUF2007 domain-containing protein [Vibrio sp. qd031]ORT49478.1 hypothetical protein ST37_13855 [Vibrio sp. qd031]
MKLYSAANPTEAHLLSELLRSQRIQVEVRGDALFSLKGELPLTDDSDPYVWLLDLTQQHQAEKIVQEFVSQANDTSGPNWRCEHCGEENEPQFGACWQCSTAH